MSTTGYINSIAGAAQDAVTGTGLFASVMIAQAAEESGYGASPLASKYNNHFGIKASGSWGGGTVKMDTTEYSKNQPYKIKADFRTYSSLADGFADRVKFLQANSRYKKSGVFSAATPEDQARALQNAGYATDPQYADKLINIIAANNLKQYDSVHVAQSTGASQKKAVGDHDNIWISLAIVLTVLSIFFALEELT